MLIFIPSSINKLCFQLIHAYFHSSSIIKSCFQVIDAYFHSFSRNESRYERAPPPPRFAQGGSGGRGRGGLDHGHGASSRGGRGRGGRGGSAPPGARGGRKPQLTKQNSSELANEEWETDSESSDVLTQDRNHDKASKNDLKDKESKKGSNNAAPSHGKVFERERSATPSEASSSQAGEGGHEGGAKANAVVNNEGKKHAKSSSSSREDRPPRRDDKRGERRERGDRDRDGKEIYNRDNREGEKRLRGRKRRLRLQGTQRRAQRPGAIYSSGFPTRGERGESRGRGGPTW